MKLGHSMAILFLVIGGVLTGIYLALLNSSGYTFRILMAGPALMGVGVAMIFFPGANISMEENSARNGKVDIWQEAPTIHKIAWVIGGVAGFLLSLSFFFRG